MEKSIEVSRGMWNRTDIDRIKFSSGHITKENEIITNWLQLGLGLCMAEWGARHECWSRAQTRSDCAAAPTRMLETQNWRGNSVGGLVGSSVLMMWRLVHLQSKWTPRSRCKWWCPLWPILRNHMFTTTISVTSIRFGLGSDKVVSFKVRWWIWCQRPSSPRPQTDHKLFSLQIHLLT